MSLFDQQPMGPVPARRPILVPPDPELEQAVEDPAAVEVELVDPVPRELRDATPPTGPRRRRWVWLFALVLVLPLGYDLAVALSALVVPGTLDDAGRVPGLIVPCLLVLVGLVAFVVSRRR
jgi:hypothetical protein